MSFRRSLIALGVLGGLCLPAPLAAQGFYAGKTVTMLINYGAGGPNDLEGRILARHLPKHVAGKPSFVVVNRPGGGGLAGINYLGSGAVRPDGLSFGYFTTNVVAPITGDPALKVKYDQFDFIAGLPQYSVAFGIKDIAPGMTKPVDIVRATDEIFVGSYGPTSSMAIRLRLAFELLGVKFRVVAGYQSSVDIQQAMLRKEIGFGSSATSYFFSNNMPGLVKPGIAMPFWYYQVSAPDGSYKKHARLESMGVPAFAQVYEEAVGRKPSGPKWEALVLVNNLSTSMLRVTWMPGGSPKPAVAELRAAFAALGNDAAFQDEFGKLMGEKAEFISATEGEKLLSALVNVDPVVAETVRATTRKP